ncbi:hypothetical protein C8R46DRAFT_1287287 [Mycena filopes]|nr:hypothetical protein C8R46DRAFT_1287287 [Mycena filopes]
MPYRTLSSPECEAIRAAQRDNICPTFAEEAAIRKALAEAQSQWDAAQYDEAQDAIMHRDIAYQSVQLAPVRRLPPEILSAIFVDPTFDNAATRGALALGGQKTDPITAVSFHWRATALSTPQFWSTLSVSVSSKKDISELLRLYLERSKSHPLSLDIWNKESSPPDEAILACLLSTSERWSTLHINLESHYLPSFDAVRGRLPRLESFTLSGSTITDLSVGTPEIHKTNGFELAPRLRRLNFHLSLALLPPLPLHQVKLLLIPHSAAALASLCPNLTTLVCTAAVREEPGSPVATNATTLHLHASFLHFHDVTAPKAAFLRLVGVSSPWSQSRFAEFAQRSQCATALHTLVLDDILIHQNDMLALLPLIPAVRTLSIHKLLPNALTDNVIHALTPTDKLLPELTALTAEGPYRFGTASLLMMLEARAPALRTVTLHLTAQNFDVEEQRRLRALNGSRMVLSVKCLNAEKEYFTMI